MTYRENNLSGEIRLFLAVPLPLRIQKKLFETANRMRFSGADVKWVSMENLHITLKFLGHVHSKKLPDLCRALNGALSGLSAFKAVFSGLGAFPGIKRARVLWAGIGRGSIELAQLAGIVESALIPLGFPHEEKEFRSHVTLGRVKSARNISALAEYFDKLKELSAGGMKVAHVHLMRSELHREGPVYSLVESFELAGESPIIEED